MTAADRYSTPASFRRALTDRLKLAAKESRWSVPQLQRQVAYDRLLERLYLVDAGWIVKGATALLARDLGVRGTLDIDLYRQAAREVAEADLRRAAAADVGDWFRFEIGAGSVLGNAGLRLPVKSVIGATTWTGFHIDLVGSGVRMTGQPEDVPPLARGAIPEVSQHGYKAYPLIDHVADKVAATYERYGETRMPSTRYRDLVDLISIVTGTRNPAIVGPGTVTAIDREPGHSTGASRAGRFREQRPLGAVWVIGQQPGGAVGEPLLEPLPAPSAVGSQPGEYGGVHEQPDDIDGVGAVDAGAQRGPRREAVDYPAGHRGPVVA